MNGVVADAIGLLGSTLFIIGFLYSNLAETIDFRLFNILNLLGSILLVTSLTVHFNLAAMMLEVSWGFIALFGLIKALRKRRPA